MRIVVGLDGSPEAESGLDFVVRLRPATDDDVAVAVVAEVPQGLAFSMAGPSYSLAWYDEVRQSVLDEAARIANAAAQRLGSAWHAVPIVREGHPVDVLGRLARERNANLLVVGPHGRGRIESVLFGSVSQGLLHAMPTSVLVARPIRDDLRSVVLAVDGSTGSRAAAEFLASLRLPGDARIAVTSVVSAGTPGYGRGWREETVEQLEADEQTAAEAAIEDALGVLRSGGWTATGEVRSGLAKQAIIDMAKDRSADLVVVGSRGLGGFESLLLGSVSRAVSKAAPCSVIVVRHP